MIELRTELGKAQIVEQPSELPSMNGVRRMYLDIESNSFDSKTEAFYPYLGHRIASIAVLRDNEPNAWYIPVRHTNAKWNLPLDSVRSWLTDAMKVPEWANHNVKFDAHFCAFDAPAYRGSLIDTLVLTKLHDSDRYDHKLKAVCRDWLGLKLEDIDAVEQYLKSVKSKNYGDVPGDILGKYACMDVLSNRMLLKWIIDRIPADMREFVREEIALTPVLFDMEREGMQTNPDRIRVESLKSLERIIDYHEKLEELTSDDYVDSSAHHYDILVNRLGLPVLKLATGKDKDGNVRIGGPSFDAEALSLYTIHPAVTSNPKAAELIKTLIANRTEAHFRSLFLDAFIEHSDKNGVLHPSYNQMVRTGRTSCSKPNAQQMNKRAKNLIIPKKGDALLSSDASQIEFRLIMSYAKDKDAIARYNEDPNTDFHQYVADQVHIKRQAGKTLNFAMGYGAGRRRVIRLLSGNPDVMEDVSTKINELIGSGKLDETKREKEYTELCEEMAARFYSDYHSRFGGIKSVSKIAERMCRSRAKENEKEIGWIANAFGGRRHLPLHVAHKAFNTVIQGGAMKYIKNKMIQLSPRNCSWMRDAGVRLFVCVHDELVWCGPRDFILDPRTHARFKTELEALPRVKLDVPMVWDLKASAKNWASVCELSELSEVF